MNQNEQLQQPFFAQFLESQKTVRETTNKNQQDEQKGITFPLSDWDQTLKFPSDSDEDIS